MATLSFDNANRVATSDSLTITVQEIYDQFRDYEDELAVLDLPQMITGSGQDPLPGGDITITNVTLLDGWRIAFPAGAGPAYDEAVVSGGNLLARVGDIESATQSPFAPTPFVSPSAAAATSGALASPATLESINAIMRNKTVTFPTDDPGSYPGEMVVFDTDGTTVLFRAKVYEDTTEIQEYRRQGIEVRERLEEP